MANNQKIDNGLLGSFVTEAEEQPDGSYRQVIKVAETVGGGSGTEYTEGDADASITGTAILWEDSADTLATVSASSPLPVDGTVTANLSATDNAVLDAIAASTAAIEAGQLPDSHGVTVDNASIAITAASLPLPSGAATSANQQTDALTDTELRATPVPVSAASLPLPSGAATSANQQTDALTDTELRATPVPIKLPQGSIDTFAHLMTAQSNNQIDIQFYRDTPASLVNVSATAGGSASASGGTATFSTSTNSNGNAKGVTGQTTIYHSGAEMYALFTAAWPNGGGSAGSFQRIGLYDDNDGFFIGYEGTTFGITVRKGGSDTQTAKSSFSQDDLTGGASSQFTRTGSPEAIDLTKLNVFRVRFGWLGSAPIEFEILSPDDNWVLFHEIKQPNLSATASIENADLPITAHVDNNGANSTDLQILSNCWGAGTTLAQGKISDSLSTEALATLNRSVIAGETTAGGGGLVNVKVTPSGALEVEAQAAFASISTVSDNKLGSVVAVDVTSTTLVAANTDRFNVVIENRTSQDIFICLGPTATTATAFMILYDKGDVLNIPGWYHNGAISAIHAGTGTKNVQVTEVEDIP